MGIFSPSWLVTWHCTAQPRDVNEPFKGKRKGTNDIRGHDARAWPQLEGCRALQQQAKGSQQTGQGLKTSAVIWKFGLTWSTAQAIMVTHLPASTLNRSCCGTTEYLHLSNANTTLWSECFLFYFAPEEMSPPKDIRCSPKRADEITVSSSRLPGCWVLPSFWSLFTWLKFMVWLDDGILITEFSNTNRSCLTLPISNSKSSLNLCGCQLIYVYGKLIKIWAPSSPCCSCIVTALVEHPRSFVYMSLQRLNGDTALLGSPRLFCAVQRGAITERAVSCSEWFWGKRVQGSETIRGSNTGLSFPACVEHIYPPHTITRRKPRKNVLLNKWRTGPLQRANEQSWARPLCSGTLFQRHNLSPGWTALPTPSPCWIPPGCQDSGFNCTLTRGWEQLFGGGICLWLHGQEQGNTCEYKISCLRFSCSNVGTVWATLGPSVWSPVAVLQWSSPWQDLCYLCEPFVDVLDMLDI